MKIKKIDFHTQADIEILSATANDSLKNLYVSQQGDTFLIDDLDDEVDIPSCFTEIKFYHFKDHCFYPFNEINKNPEKIANLVPNRLLIETLKKLAKQSLSNISITCPILETEINIPLINIKSGYSYDNNYATMENIFSRCRWQNCIDIFKR